MMALTTLNSSAQMQLPKQLRARGMSCYLTAFAAAMAGGSLVWGKAADTVGLTGALAIAAAVLVATAVVGAGLVIRRPEI